MVTLDNESILKAERAKVFVPQKETLIRLSKDFPETFQARRGLDDVRKELQI